MSPYLDIGAKHGLAYFSGVCVRPSIYKNSESVAFFPRAFSLFFPRCLPLLLVKDSGTRVEEEIASETERAETKFASSVRVSD